MIRNPLVLLGVWSLFAGCQWAESFGTAKIDNPVMGPPPPRTSMSEVHRGEHALAANNDDAGRASLAQTIDAPSTQADLAQATFDPSTAPKAAVMGNQVVATVNGSPIFAADILEPYSKKLESHRGGMTSREFDELQRAIVRRDLPVHIDNRLLVVALRSTLKKEQLESMDKELKRQFSERLAEMQKKAGAASLQELEEKLEKEQGISLAYLRTMDYNHNMVGAYLNTKIGKDKQPIFGRPELWAYYDAHRSDYDVPAEVKWQQLQVSFAKHGGKQQAWRVFDKAVQELLEKKGENFNEVVKQYTDGPKRDKGGQMGWTREGSLANKNVERALFELPVGEISAPITDKDSFILVRIMDRKQKSRKSFDEVQQEIEKQLQIEHRNRLLKETMAELKQNAVIQTIFDDEKKDHEVDGATTVKAVEENASDAGAGVVKASDARAAGAPAPARNEPAALPFE